MAACVLLIDAGPLTHYIAVRPDLPLGLLAAQVAHAAGESSPGELPPGTHVVVLAATPEQLEALHHRLEAQCIPHAPVVESDAPYTGQLMALGLAPAPRAELKRYVSSLPLLGKEAGV